MTLSRTRSPISSLAQKSLAMGAGESVLVYRVIQCHQSLTRIRQASELHHDPVNLVALGRNHVLNCRDAHVLDAAAQAAVGEGQ